VFDISAVDLKTDVVPPGTLALAEKLVEVCRGRGFFVVKGHGLSEETIRRHFDLGKMLLDDVPLEEKKALLSSSWETGQWAGYKVRNPSFAREMVDANGQGGGLAAEDA
jgi:isopenicillin N synthase-like dioxygenase